MTVNIPPITSILLAVLSFFLLFHKRLTSVKEFLEISSESEIKLNFGVALECEEIREIIKEFDGPEEFLKLAKNISADSFKKLIECEILKIEKDKKFFNEFCDWENFNLKYPKEFEEFEEILRIEDMTTFSLESLPVQFIVKKVDKFDELIEKLPMKKILNNLIEESNFQIWKSFNENVFNQLETDEQTILIKYLSNVPVIVEEDLLLLLLRTENFLISSLMTLKGFNQSEYEWIDRFHHVERILEKFLLIRRKLNQQKATKFSNFLISKKLKDALKNIVLKIDTSILGNVLLIPKPFDPNLYPPDEHQKTTTATTLLNFYKTEKLFESFEFNEFKFVKDPFILLEILKSFSDDPVLILQILESVHVFDLIYTEPFYVCEWIRKALELGSPAVLNFIYVNYKKIVKGEIKRVIEKAKKEEIVKNVLRFFDGYEIEDELKFLLLLPSKRLMDTQLHLDFIADMTSHENGAANTVELHNINTVSIDNSLRLEYSADLKMKREFVEEAYRFYLKEQRRLGQQRLNVKFRMMNGQDTGGLGRQFLMIIFGILVEEELGLFHIVNERVIPRTLLDANVLGFLGMLHGQALKLSLKVPWLIDFNYENQPIKLCDLIKELERNSEGGLVPTCHDIILHLNHVYKLFHDKFDLSDVIAATRIDSEYLKVLETLERSFWQAGHEAYKSNLLSSIDRELRDHVHVNQIIEMIKPLKSSEIDSNEFLKCFHFTGEAKNLIKRIVTRVISANPQEMIPATLKFVSGSIELPPAGLASLHLIVNTVVTENYYKRRLPQASTCHKIINWTIFDDESEEELVERFKTALKETQGFELE